MVSTYKYVCKWPLWSDSDFDAGDLLILISAVKWKM